MNKEMTLRNRFILTSYLSIVFPVILILSLIHI